MTVYRVTFNPSRQVHIDVDAANPNAAIARARDMWNANASDPQFVTSEGAHDAAFATASAQPLTRLYEVSVTESSTSMRWLFADSEDEALSTAEDLYHSDRDGFEFLDHQLAEIIVRDHKEA